MIDSTIEQALRAEETASAALAGEVAELSAELAEKKSVFIVTDYGNVERVFSTREKAEAYRMKIAEPFAIIEYEIDGARVF